MHRKKARIVCTIGPASSSPETIKKLIQNGLNVARLNFSHGTHDDHRRIIQTVRSVAKELKTHVGILQDLCGPKIRLGILPDEGVLLIQGEEVALRSYGDYEEGVMPLSYPDIHKEVFAGEAILLADGLIELEVVRIHGDKVVCKIHNGGRVFSRKGVNLPNSKLSISAFSEKDRADLIMGLEEKVDFVAVSFVRTVEDLDEVKKLISQSKHKPKLIAKIEKPQAVANLESIIARVDAVMVARGDLGVEMPLERVPIIQKQIIKAVRSAGKPVITATQMLMSMVSSPRPTRGEVSDVANAIIDGTDAVMLSDESANGSYPVEACRMLATIADATEPYVGKNTAMDLSCIETRQDISFAVGRAAASLAEDINAAAIVAYTQSGFTAFAVAQFRPKCQILAMTANIDTCRQLTLCWGTKTVLLENFSQDYAEKMFEAAKTAAIQAGIANRGDKIVVTAGVPLGTTGSTTLLRVLDV